MTLFHKTLTLSVLVAATLTASVVRAEDPSTGAVPAQPGGAAKEVRKADRTQIAADRKSLSEDRQAVRAAAKDGDKDAAKAAIAEAKADRKTASEDKQKLREDRRSQREDARDAVKQAAADKKAERGK